MITQSETVVIKRTKINFAPYNPKRHSKDAISKQKANFKKVGFLGGIVWNELTSNIISGHKRVMALDLINKFDGTEQTDYDIKVEKVNFDEQTEKEQNIYMDASSANTKQDADLLKLILPDINFENAGLTELDLSFIGYTPIEYMTNNDDTKEEFESLVKPYNERKQDLKSLKKDIRQKIENSFGEGDTYVMISFNSFEAKQKFMERFGYNPDDKFIIGEIFEQNIERLE